MNRLSVTKRAQVVNALVEGMSIRATCRLTGICKDAALKLLCDLGAACAAHHNAAVRGVRSRRVQCDEAWSFCYAKAKNVTEEKKAQGAGDVWTWVGIDADTKLIISYLCGGRDAEWACKFMEDLASRVTTRLQITTDGLRAYAEAVEGAFGIDVDYAMLIKLYGAPSDRPDTRYSPAQCIGTRTGVLSGSPDPRHISTSYVERYNLNLRMGRSALHATHKRLFKEIREPLPSRGDLPHLLQLLPRPPDFAGDARDGSRSNRSRVVNGGTDRAARSDESQRGLTL